MPIISFGFHGINLYQLYKAKIIYALINYISLHRQQNSYEFYRKTDFFFTVTRQHDTYYNRGRACEAAAGLLFFFLFFFLSIFLCYKVCILLCFTLFQFFQVGRSRGRLRTPTPPNQPMAGDMMSDGRAERNQASQVY